MAELGMSLDDIISKTKSASKRGRGRGGAVRNQNRHSNKSSSSPYSLPSKPIVKLGSEKIVVSNLAYSVTEADVKELFGQIGQLKSAQLNYNAEGKSKGIANVVFQKPADAAKAVKEYNNRTFDGRPMKIELVVSADAVPKLPATSRLGAPVNKPKTVGGVAGRGGLSKRGVGRGRGRGRRFNAKGKPKTAEELDAELEGYMNDESMEDAGAADLALANAI